MADNPNLPLTGSGDSTARPATKDVSWSGQTAHIQLVELVYGSGSEGARSLNELANASGIIVQGAAAENAAAAGNPVLAGGRYDASARTLGDGTVGALALTASGHALVETASEYAVGTAAGGSDVGQLSLVQRDDGLATITPADGDYTVLRVDSTGALWTRSATIDGAHSADFDTGAGSDTTLAFGIAVPQFGGAGVVPGDAVNGLYVQTNELTPGTGASNLGKAEDAAHSSGDVGVMALVVRNDTLAALATTDGDYAPLQVNADGALYVDGSGVTQPISAASLPLPSGAATAANQSTGNSSLSTIAGAVHNEDDAHTTADPGFQALAVRNDTLAALAGTDGDYSPLQVDADGALYVNIASGSSSGTEYTEDTAGAGAESGPFVLGRRQDGDTSPVSTDGDYHGLIFDNAGNLKVNVKLGGTAGTQYVEDDAAPANPTATAVALVRADSPAGIASADGDIVAQRATDYGAAYVQILTSSGSFVDSFGGGTQYAVSDGLGATPTGTLSLARRDDALSTLTPVEDDAVALRVDANGALWVIPSGTVTVDGSGVTQPVSAASLPLPSGAATAANQSTANGHLSTLAGAVSGTEFQVDVLTLPALPAGTNNIGDVDVLTLPALPAGTNNIGEIDVVGDVAHGATDSGEPVKIGAKAIPFGSTPTEVDDNDRTDLYATPAGVQFVIGGHPNVQTIEYFTTAVQTNDVVITAAAGERIIVTSVEVTLDEATSVGVGYRLAFGASSLPTAPTSGNTADDTLSAHPGLAAGSGVVKGDGSGIIGASPAAGDDLRIANDVPTDGGLKVVISYFIDG